MDELIKRLNENLSVLSCEYIDDTMIINVENKNQSAICPDCGKEYSSIHSWYPRDIKDLPIQGYKVIIRLKVKVFNCKNKECGCSMFDEKFDFCENYSRMTNRLKNKIINFSKHMSARASKKEINDGTADISDDTILRLIKKTTAADKEVKKICIDDFALKVPATI